MHDPREGREGRGGGGGGDEVEETKQDNRPVRNTEKCTYLPRLKIHLSASVGGRRRKN